MSPEEFCNKYGNLARLVLRQDSESAASRQLLEAAYEMSDGQDLSDGINVVLPLLQKAQERIQPRPPASRTRDAVFNIYGGDGFTGNEEWIPFPVFLAKIEDAFLELPLLKRVIGGERILGWPSEAIASHLADAVADYPGPAEIRRVKSFAKVEKFLTKFRDALISGIPRHEPKVSRAWLERIICAEEELDQRFRTWQAMPSIWKHANGALDEVTATASGGTFAWLRNLSKGWMKPIREQCPNPKEGFLVTKVATKEA